MLKERPPSKSGAARQSLSALGVFLSPNGRLPGFAQRRLDDLLAKKRSEGLTRKEQRELSEALDYIDSKTIEMLKYGLLPAAPNRPKASRGGTAARQTRNGKA
jgi:hypothetical protein